jgi:hypothetical protein
VGPRAVLDTVVKKKIPSSRQESNPRTPTDQPVAQRYTDCAVTSLCEGGCGWWSACARACALIHKDEDLSRSWLVCMLIP